jgi:hypothetical protein
VLFDADDFVSSVLGDSSISMHIDGSFVVFVIALCVVIMVMICINDSCIIVVNIFVG